MDLDLKVRNSPKQIDSKMFSRPLLIHQALLITDQLFLRETDALWSCRMMTRLRFL